MRDGRPICSAVPKTFEGGRVKASPSWRVTPSPVRRHHGEVARPVIVHPHRAEILAPGATGWGGLLNYPVLRDPDRPAFTLPPAALHAMASSPLPLADLPAAFRQRAEAVARFAPGVAEAFVFCAEQVEACLAGHGDETLTVRRACAESGWSYDGLRRKLVDDPTLNAGTEGAPLIRRRDLPRLGAARGPRGPYTPRKAKAEESAGDHAEAAAGEDQVETSVVEAPSAATTDAEQVEDAAQADAAVSEEMAVPTSADHAPDEEPHRLSGPTPTPQGTADARQRARKKKGRHPSRKERFDDLLTLARQS